VGPELDCGEGHLMHVTGLPPNQGNQSIIRGIREVLELLLFVLEL